MIGAKAARSVTLRQDTGPFYRYYLLFGFFERPV